MFKFVNFVDRLMEWFRKSRTKSISDETLETRAESPLISEIEPKVTVSHLDAKILNNNNKYLQLEFEQKIQDLTERMSVVFLSFALLNRFGRKSKGKHGSR